MRIVVALACLAGACTAPQTYTCLDSAACGAGTCEATGFCSNADTGCDSGRRYDETAGMMLANTCVPKLPDRDGDGKPDDMDNCPDKPNSGQENEDNDRFGDACDPCPAFPDANPVADVDGDGVSNPCDLHPDPSAPDRIVLFEGFDGGIPSGWTKNGNWMAVTGAVHVADGELTVPLPPVNSTVFAFTRFVIHTPGTVDFSAGITVAGVSCELEANNGGATQHLQLRNGASSNQAAFAFTAGIYDLVITWNQAQVFSCSVSSAGVSSAVSGTFSTSGTAVGVTGTFTQPGFDADANFVMIVGQ